MKTFYILCWLLGCSSFLLAQEKTPNEIIIALKQPIKKHQSENIFAQKEIATIFKISQLSQTLNYYKLTFDESQHSLAEMIQLLQQQPDVLYAQPNRRMNLRTEPNPPNDSLYFEQWDMDIIDAPRAWAIATGGLSAQGDTIVVAVIDNGVELAHEDLNPNIWRNQAEIPNDGMDNDNNGFVDDYFGWAFQSGNDAHLALDHGTASAGIVGAVGNNTKGVTGVNWAVKMMILSQVNTEAEIIQAYEYALQMRQKYNQTNGQAGAFVVATSLSQGFSAPPENFPLLCAMYDELGKVGILNAAATANSSIDVDIVGDVPTGCPSEFLVSVTNSDKNDELRPTAAFGKRSIDLAAPGSSSFSTGLNNGYDRASGTSAATPHVAGAIALLYALPNTAFIDFAKSNPAKGAALIKTALLNGTDYLPSLEDKTVSEGRLNLFNSLVLLQNYSAGFADSLQVVRLSPNPAQNELVIEYETPKAKVDFLVFNEIGQKVLAGQLEPVAVSAKAIQLDIAKLQNGVYFLVLKNEKTQIVQRFIVLK